MTDRPVYLPPAQPPSFGAAHTDVEDPEDFGTFVPPMSGGGGGGSGLFTRRLWNGTAWVLA